jgi:hypothetical protein
VATDQRFETRVVTLASATAGVDSAGHFADYRRVTVQYQRRSRSAAKAS